MDNDYSRLLYLFTDLIMPLVVGYILHRLHLLHGDMVNRLIKLNVVVFYTILSVLSFWVLPLSYDLAWIPAFSCVYVLLPGAIAYFWLARRYRSYLNKGAFMASAMLANIGTLGGVCAFILYREVGFAYVQLICAFQNIFLILVCFPLAQYYHTKAESINGHIVQAKSRWQNFREMFFSVNQMSLLGIGAGLWLNYTGLARPAGMETAFAWFVHISAWIALLPVGYLIDFHRAGRYYGKVSDLLVLRFVIVPAASLLLARAVFSDPILINTIFICATAPEAINATVTARLYKLNVDYTVAGFIVTTVLYLLVIFPLEFFCLR